VLAGTETSPFRPLVVPKIRATTTVFLPAVIVSGGLRSTLAYGAGNALTARHFTRAEPGQQIRNPKPDFIPGPGPFVVPNGSGQAAAMVLG